MRVRPSPQISRSLAIPTHNHVAGPQTGFQPRWEMEGEVIACPWHGLEYHVPTGRCLAFPHIHVRRYEVTVVGEELDVTPASSPRPPAASGP